MNFGSLNNLNQKYHMFIPSDCKDIEIRKLDFVAED